MNMYRFNTVVETDGTVHLSGLPPHQEVEIVIMERAGASEALKSWLNDIRGRHPFANMSKDEILEVLRNTRDVVWAERHEG